MRLSLSSNQELTILSQKRDDQGDHCTLRLLSSRKNLFRVGERRELMTVLLSRRVPECNIPILSKSGFHLCLSMGVWDLLMAVV